MGTALIIVDVQNDFCEGGSLAVAGGNRVAELVSEHLTSHGSQYDLVVTTQDWHIAPGDHWSEHPDFVDTWPRHCAVGTDGAAFHPVLAAAFTDLGLEPVRIRKGEFQAAYSGFEGFTEQSHSLEDVLREHDITDVTVVGLALDHCVRATAVDAASAGFDTTVVKEMTAAVGDPTVTFQQFEQAGVRVI